MIIRFRLARSLARMSHISPSSSILTPRLFSSALNTTNNHKHNQGELASAEEISAFPGASSPYTTDMEFKSTFKLFPCYRVTDQIGSFLIEPKHPSVIKN